jgi:hypothetical protein
MFQTFLFCNIGERFCHRSMPMRRVFEALLRASCRRTPSTGRACSETQLLDGLLQHVISKGKAEHTVRSMAIVAGAFEQGTLLAPLLGAPLW